jgi:hypothetical protein
MFNKYLKWKYFRTPFHFMIAGVCGYGAGRYPYLLPYPFKRIDKEKWEKYMNSDD